MSKLNYIICLIAIVLFQSCNWEKQYINLEVGEYWVDNFNQSELQNTKVVGDKLFCNTISFEKANFLYCLSLTTGKVIWKYPISHYASQPIVIFDDFIYFSTYLGEVSKISLDGNKIWKIKFPSSYAGHEINPINGNLFVNSVVYGVYEFDSKNGELIYHYKFDHHKSTHHYTMPVVYESSLIFGNIEIDSNQTESFIAIDYKNKKKIWESNLKKSVKRHNTIPLLHKNYLVSIEQNKDSIHCIDVRNGNLLWSQKVHKKGEKNWSIRYRIEKNNVFYHKGGFIALDLSTGKEKKVEMENNEELFQITKDNQVYEISIMDKLETDGLEIKINKI